MTDVITLSDDDFSPAKHSSISRRPHNKTAKQWNELFSQKNHREQSGHSSDSHCSRKNSAKQYSGRSSERSSKHSSHCSPGRRAHHSSSRDDREQHRSRRRSASQKSIIELVISDDDTKSFDITSCKKTSHKKSTVKSTKVAPDNGHSKKSSRDHNASKSSSSHSHAEKSLRHPYSGSSSHYSKRSPDKSHSKTASEKVSLTKISSEKACPSGQAGLENYTTETSPLGPALMANGCRSGSRRSLAAELGVSKADCRRTEDDPSPRHCRLVANGQHAVTGADQTAGDGRTKRQAFGHEETVKEAKRVRLTRVEADTGSDASPAAPDSRPEQGQCRQSLEEVCALLKPLLSGPELKLEAKVRRRHAAVAALACDRTGRMLHLTGVTQQCAERLRAEPERCFTVLRGFLEQLDQIKIVASSAQSRVAPAISAPDKTDTTEGANNAKARRAAVALKADAGAAAATARKAAAADVTNVSPSVTTKMNGSAKSAPAPEQEEKESRRHRRHIAKLEKTLRRLEREIVRQDEQEVDWDDAAGSAYIVGARLKRRYVQVYRYYCQLVGATEEAQRLDSRRIRFEGTRYPELNRRIEKFVNQTREFPDFKDVLSLMESANRRCRLNLGPGALHDQAKEAFLQLGAQLQKRRRAALAESMDSLAGAEEWRGRDPAAGDPTLGGRLAENAASGKEKLNQVFSEFVQRQEAAAAERRQKRTDAAEGSEDEGETEGTEEAEDSEVTDEELERERPRPSVAMSDLVLSEQEGAPPGAEDMGTDSGTTKEEGELTRDKKPGDLTGEGPTRERDVNKERGLDGRQNVVETTGSGAENGTLTSPGAQHISKDGGRQDAKDDHASSADLKGNEILEVNQTGETVEDSAESHCVSDGKRAEEFEQGCDLPKHLPSTANLETNQQIEDKKSTESENKNSDQYG